MWCDGRRCQAPSLEPFWEVQCVVDDGTGQANVLADGGKEGGREGGRDGLFIAPFCQSLCTPSSILSITSHVLTLLRSLAPFLPPSLRSQNWPCSSYAWSPPDASDWNANFESGWGW